MWCCWFQAFWAWSLSTEGLKSLWLAKDLWLRILKSNLKPSCLWSYMCMTCCGGEQYVLPFSVNAFSHNTDCSNPIVGSIQLSRTEHASNNCRLLHLTYVPSKSSIQQRKRACFSVFSTNQDLMRCYTFCHPGYVWKLDTAKFNG